MHHTQLSRSLLTSGGIITTVQSLGHVADKFHLIHNSSCDSHAIEDGDINDRWHSSIVDGLGAVGPHVGTLSQVDVARTQAETRRECYCRLYQRVTRKQAASWAQGTPL